MDFSKDFFRSEVIDGFYVPAIMKRSWASTMEILNYIAELCEEHHIKWWLDYGTMLGAVRHGGFIPWDDDVDISMPREDYRRFIKIINIELPAEYMVSSIYSDEDSEYFTMGICNGGGKGNYDDFLRKYHGFPYQSVVDVFVYDDIDIDEAAETIKRDSIKLMISIIDKTNHRSLIRDCPEHIIMLIEKIESVFQCTFDREKPINRQLMLLCDRMMQSDDTDIPAKEMACKAYIRGDDYELRAIKKEYEFLIHASHLYEYPIPIITESSLNKQYGDYINPIRGISDHKYPNYEKYSGSIDKKAGFQVWNSYVFQEADIQDRNTIDCADKSNTEVVFLVTRSSNWKYMEREYSKYNNNDHNKVYVIPIPYYDKNYRNEFDELYFETEGFPEDVRITKPDEYDFYERRPDVVYFDDPYDNYDAFTSVYPLFYSDKIRQFAKKMVYVSCILVDEYDKDEICAIKMMRHCILTPGVARADEVIVQSENMRQRYIEALTEWAGKDTKPIWERRVKGTGLNRDVIKEYPDIRREELDNEWIDCLYKADGSRKEVVLYHLGINSMAKYGDPSINKMKEMFSEFKNDNERILYFNPDSRIEEYMKEYDEELWNSYSEAVSRFIEDDYGIFDDGEDDYFMVCLCDRFIGDTGKVMYHCIRAGKPVEKMMYEG